MTLGTVLLVGYAAGAAGAALAFLLRVRRLLHTPYITPPQRELYYSIAVFRHYTSVCGLPPAIAVPLLLVLIPMFGGLLWPYFGGRWLYRLIEQMDSSGDPPAAA